MSPHVVRTARPLPLLASVFAFTALLQGAGALYLLVLLPGVHLPVPAYAGGTLVAAYVLRRLAAARRGLERARRIRNEVRFLSTPLPPDALGACVRRRDHLFGDGLIHGMLHWIGKAAPVPLATEPETARRSYLFSRALRPLRPLPLNADPLLLVLAVAVWRTGGLSPSLALLDGYLLVAAAPIVLGGVLRWALRGAFDRLCDALAAWTLAAPLVAARPGPKRYVHTAHYRARLLRPILGPEPAVSRAG